MQSKQQIRKAIRSARRQLRWIEEELRKTEKDYVIAGEEAERVSGYELVMREVRRKVDEGYRMLR